MVELWLGWGFDNYLIIYLFNYLIVSISKQAGDELCQAQLSLKLANLTARN